MQFEELERYLADEKNMEGVTNAKLYAKAKEFLRDMRELAMLVETDPNLSPQEKRAEIDKLGKEVQEFTASIVGRKYPKPVQEKVGMR